MKMNLAPIRPGLLAAITLSILFSVAPADAHGPQPSVTSAPASGITTTAATLNGTVNANGSAATAWFQWGATTNYGNLTSATNLLATNATLPVSIVVSNLTPGLTYHFCAAASNSYGMATGTGPDFPDTSPLHQPQRRAAGI